VFWCSSLRDALTFAHFGSSSHCNVFLATLGTMFHLSLGVWTNILSIFLFVYLLVLFVFVYKKKKKKNYFAMLLIGHDLHHNCGLCVIGVFNLFEHCISLEIPVFFFNSCVGLERLHLFN
jgi:uncharacterized membrane protein YczE